jgi:lipoate-protein ligase A
VNSFPPFANWRLLDLSFPTPFQNLALEETLARSTTLSAFRPTVRLWVDPPTVVFGRFQDIEAEADVEFCTVNKIQIARRFTGGGAVFHDRGTLNFTIVTRPQERIPLSRFYEFNSSIVVNLLDRVGLKGSFVPPNSIHVSRRKISGAAAALGRDFALWHTSILVSTDTTLLDHVLSPKKKHDGLKSIRSIRQPVTTVEACLGHPVGLEEIKVGLVNSFENVYQTRLEAHGLLIDEELSMSRLHAQKYSSQEWNVCGNSAQLEEKNWGTHTTIAV